MNTKDFLLAMNEIDQKYIKQADIFAPATPVKTPVIFRVLRWAGAAAACVLVAAGLWLMWDLGLLADINQVPASQGAKDARNIQPGEPTPLSELPALEFPTREEVGERSGYAVGCGMGLSATPMTEEQIAAIWGQEESLAWEGLYLTGPYAGYHSNATAFYDEDGKLSYLSLEVKKNSTLSPECSFTVEIAPGHINALGSHMTGPPSRTCDVWGTEVTTLAGYNEFENFAGLSISFLTGPEGEEGTLGVTAKSLIWEGDHNGWVLEDGEELLTRLASQCLRPGNTFTLDGLLLLPESGGLPDIDFSAVTQQEMDNDFNLTDRFESSIEYQRTVNLTKEQIASIWGQEASFLSWKGRTLLDFAGKAYLDENGNVTAVQVVISRNLTGNDVIQNLAPIFYVNLFPGGLPEDGFFEGSATKTTDVMGTTVEACREDISTADLCGELATISIYKARFDRVGKESYAENNLGVEIVGVTAFLDGELYSSSLLDEEGMKELVSQCVGQMFEQGQIMDISHLADAISAGESASSTPEAEGEYSVRITDEGYLYDGGDASTFPGGAYGAFLNGPAVLTGDDAASNAADDSCIQVLNLDLPLVLVGRKEIEPAIGENGRELCALYSVGYGFFERDGEKIIQEVTGYADVAGVITTPRGGAVNFNAWYPKDGTEYFPSIVEFIGGDESAAEQAVQQAREWPEKAKGYAEKLLASYMVQNNMTGWKLRTTDEDQNNVLILFGPQEGNFEEAAKEIAQQYVDSWLSISEPAYPPLAECFYTDLKWAESPDPDSDLQVSCWMVFRLKDPEGGLGDWIAGNTNPGTGEYEGYYTAARFIYAKQENGRWVITSSGTGP